MISGQESGYCDLDMNPINAANGKRIKNSMYKVLFDENYRNKIIEKSQNHYKKFSWKKTVFETLRVLDY